jgi:hypothetical protein
VYIKGDEDLIKANRRTFNAKCTPRGPEKVVVVGGYVVLESNQGNVH